MLGPIFVVAFASVWQMSAQSGPAVLPQSPAQPNGVQAPPAYVLGPDDQITIHAIDAEEISEKPFRIDMSGNLRLPLAGTVRAGGLTVSQLESDLESRLKTYIRDPKISISVTEFRSQPVSVLGALRNPGVIQLQGRKTLIEMLSLAGGLSDAASHSVKITRRLEWGHIPLAGASTDPSGQYSIAEVNLKDILEARGPEGNILICPHDVISVPRAEMVYVTGQVMRSGGFVLNERESISVLQALSLAGGLDRAASAKNARILRTAEGAAERTEIPVNLDKIMSGSISDVPMLPEDILFVPSSAPKRAALRAVEAAIQMGTGIVIWRR